MNKLDTTNQGFTTGYSAMSQIRWHSILDLKDKSEQIKKICHIKLDVTL